MMLGTTLMTVGAIGIIVMAIVEDVRFSNSYEVDTDLVKRTVNKLIPNNVVIYYIDNENTLESSLAAFRGHLTDKEIKEVEDLYHLDGCCGCNFERSNLAIIFMNEIKRGGYGDIFDIAKLVYKTVIHEVVHSVYDTSDEDFVEKKTAELMESADLPFPFKHIWPTVGRIFYTTWKCPTIHNFSNGESQTNAYVLVILQRYKASAF